MASSRSRSISNQTLAEARSTPQRSAICSTKKSPQPRSPASSPDPSGGSNPGPGSRTSQRITESSIVRLSEIDSSGPAFACLTLLVTSSLTSSRTSNACVSSTISSISDSARRAAVTAYGPPASSKVSSLLMVHARSRPCARHAARAPLCQSRGANLAGSLGARRYGLWVRGVRELAEEPGDHECRLLSDVHRVVADALEPARHEHHVHRPLAHLGVVTDLDRELEALPVEPVDGLVLADQVLGEPDVATSERLLRLHHLGTRLGGHLHDLFEHAWMRGRLRPGEREQLADVHALVAHPLDVLDHLEQRGDQPQVAGDRSLPGEQRKHALVNLEIAAVEAVVVLDHELRQLD